jgi:hypothetical protein
METRADMLLMMEGQTKQTKQKQQTRAARTA